MNDFQIIDATSDNILDYGVCGYKSLKRPGYPERIDWIKEWVQKGLKIKLLVSATDGTQGMIEYLPGEYCWRPISAIGYTFIHCIFVGFKKIYKNKGYASLLIQECLKDAQETYGVAVVTRKGSFMVDKHIFLKRGFEVVDKAPSDFELLVKRFNDEAPLPKFKTGVGVVDEKYQDGLVIIRANQCPYTVKNVDEIVETAQKTYQLTPTIINLTTPEDVQNTPCPFGIFCLIYNGQIIAEHPISNKRFMNIMNKLI